MPSSKLLVLTALEETWGKSEPLLFLGEWCKLYDRRSVWETRSHEVFPFHWDDREKLAEDYDYLNGLHQRLLSALVGTLNNLHQVNYSLRYWQILLDPWLLTYISALFDRWENIRLVFEKNEDFDIILLETEQQGLSSFSYAEFIKDVLSDRWNQLLCQRIIKDYYQDRCKVRETVWEPKTKEQEDLKAARKNSIVGKLVSNLDAFLGRCSSTYNVLFFMSNFNPLALVYLNLNLAQIPRFFLSEFKLPQETDFDVDASERASIEFDFKPQTVFEELVKAYVLDDLPISLVEGYHSLQQRAQNIKIKTQAIVTAGGHWTDVVAKFFFAQQIALGKKLIVLEHGGSLPATKELFDFEEDIADIKGTWFLPYHPRHVQVPPSKLVNRYKPKWSKKQLGQYCAVIGNECPRWAYRCHFYPIGSQCLTSFDLVMQFYANLNQPIKNLFKVKPYPNQGINTHKRYEDQLGREQIFSEASIDQVFRQSRIIICTYPETTFAEAMASAIPTMMLYPQELYERHPITIPILELLREAKIVFHDAQLAAEHLNQVWDDVDAWWYRSDVVRTRAAFAEQALGFTKHWPREWKKFINTNVKVA